jgi:mono/diheme cytochrome c family protein
LTVDARFLQRGRERYAISCAPCHGALGDGNGITKAYGMGATPTFHDDRIRSMAEGELFNTITNGKGTMMGYADKVVPEDRWAIVAYVRALQRAQHGSVADVPAAHKAELGIQ